MTRSRMRSRSNFGNGGEDVHLELSGWRGGVDAPRQAHKGDPKYLEFVQECDQVLQASAEPIQTPADQHVKASAFGIADQGIKGRAFILGHADALVGAVTS